MMKSWYMCVLWAHLSALVLAGFNDEAMQQAIAEAINNHTTGTICLKAKVTGKVGLCVYIHDAQATWEEAVQECTSWGGHLPEDHKERSDDSIRTQLEETNIAFLTTQIRFSNGTWLGGRMLPIEGQGSPKPGTDTGTGSRDEGDKCNPPPPTAQPEPACFKQQDIKCGTVFSSNIKTELSRCNCFRPRPYMCVTSRDKHTQICPNGFNTCSSSHFCYKPGDSNLNWFRANERCADDQGKLPGMDNEGLDNITAIMKCAGLEDIWTSDSEAEWIWMSTGKTIKSANWQQGQPKCAPMDCLKMEINGEWSAIDCKLKNNFMCIKRNTVCDTDSCEVISYDDSIKDLRDDQSVGINSNSNQNGRQLLSSQPLSTCQEVVVGVVIAIVAVIVIFIILLVILLRQNRKYKEKLVSTTGGSQFGMKGTGRPESTTHENAYVQEG